MKRPADTRQQRPPVDLAAGTEVTGEPRTERPLGEVIKSIADDTATIVRKEVELARRELMDALTARLRAAAALGAAAVAGFLVVLFLGFAGAAALGLVLPAWASWLIVAAVFAAVAGAGATFAKSRMKSPPLPPEETVKTVRDDIAWAREHLRRSGGGNADG